MPLSEAMEAAEGVDAGHGLHVRGAD
eukprot:SAG11_NODE_7601_length_1123_cov_1.040039_1_plen_25_part_10